MRVLASSLFIGGNISDRLCEIKHIGQFEIVPLDFFARLAHLSIRRAGLDPARLALTSSVGPEENDCAHLGGQQLQQEPPTQERKAVATASPQGRHWVACHPEPPFDRLNTAGCACGLQENHSPTPEGAWLPLIEEEEPSSDGPVSEGTGPISFSGC